MIINATSDNVFIGAVVLKNKIPYNVYKVNKNFVWAGPSDTETVLDDWSLIKRKKWVDFMAEIKAKKLTYDKLFLDEDSKKNKNKFASRKGKKGSNKEKLLNNIEIHEITKAFNRFKDNKNYKYPIKGDADTNIIHIIDAKENGVMTISYKYKIFNFNIETKEIEIIKDILNPV